jgi:hypothetical protein
MPDIYEMSLDQINLYIKACLAQRKYQMRADVISALAGARYDESAVQKLLRSLE